MGGIQGVFQWGIEEKVIFTFVNLQLYVSYVPGAKNPWSTMGSKLQFLLWRGKEGSGNLKESEAEKGIVRKSGWASWRSQCFLEGLKNCFILELAQGALRLLGSVLGQTKHFSVFLA